MKAPHVEFPSHPPRAARGRAIDRKIILFSTAGSFDRATREWQIPVHGWIYRPAELSRLRRLALLLTKALLRRRLPRPGPALERFDARAGAFLTDNSRGIRPQVIVGDTCHTLRRTSGSGHFKTLLRLPESAIKNLSGGAPAPFSITCRARCGQTGARTFEGSIYCLAKTGVSVISDIDDTIKVTEVLSRGKMLRNTFLKDFKAVPEMATLYRHWHTERNASFHYISASPWHLYPFLSEFLAANGFPAGTFHLRDFRLAPGDLRHTLRPGRRTKIKHARELFRRFPNRTFILVGDSGESDPIVYADLAREFPTQIQKIYIRDIAGNAFADARRQKLLARVPTDKFQFFRDAGEIH